MSDVFHGPRPNNCIPILLHCPLPELYDYLKLVQRGQREKCTSDYTKQLSKNHRNKQGKSTPAAILGHLIPLLYHTR